MQELRLCRTHGETLFVKQPADKYFRCPQCRRDAVVRRRKKVKQLAIEYKGGKCEHCGYSKCSKALEFHHKDPTQKDFGIAHKGETRAFAKIKLELDKCIMLCANCHREEHERLLLEE